MKAFDIKVYDCYDITFRLVLCKTRNEMNREVRKSNPKAQCNDNVLAHFCSTDQLVDDNLPGRFTSNVIGTMFLNLADITDEIVVHECGHAAFAFEHHVRRYTGNFGRNNSDEFNFNGGGGYEQESYCSFLGFAYEKVSQTIKQYLKEKK